MASISWCEHLIKHALQTVCFSHFDLTSLLLPYCWDMIGPNHYMEETGMEALGCKMGKQTNSLLKSNLRQRQVNNQPRQIHIPGKLATFHLSLKHIWLQWDIFSESSRHTVNAEVIQGLSIFSTHARHRAASLSPPPASSSASPIPFWGGPESRSAVPPVSPFQGLEGISYISFVQAAIGSEKA